MSLWRKNTFSYHEVLWKQYNRCYGNCIPQYRECTYVEPTLHSLWYVLSNLALVRRREAEKE